MKRLIAIYLLCVSGVFAGVEYGKTVFMDDVSVGLWTAMSNLTVAAFTGGSYTNGTNTWYYRMTGTNSKGRLPLSTNVSYTLVGDTNTNAIVLGWSRFEGIARYVVERSADGSTWTQHCTVAAGDVTWKDTGTNTWSDGSVTDTLAEISAPVVHLNPVGDGSGLSNCVATSTSGVSSVICQGGVTNSGTEADPVVELSADTTNRIAQGVAAYERGDHATNGYLISLLDGSVPAGVGDAAQPGEDGASVGFEATSYGSGVAVGDQALGYSAGVAIGAQAWGNNQGNVAIGYYARAYPDPQNWSNSCEIGTGTNLLHGGLSFRGMPLMNSNGEIVATGPWLTSTSTINYANVTNPPALNFLSATSPLNYSNVTNPPAAVASVAHYKVWATVGSEVWVTASGTGVTCNVVGGDTVEFTVPTGCILLNSQIRMPSGTSSILTIYIESADWYDGSGWGNRFGITATVFREDTGSQVSTALCKMKIGSPMWECQVLGIVDTVNCHINVNFQ